MKVEVSVIGIVLLIFVIHTVLTHLLNWMYRESAEDESGSLLFFSLILTVIEVIGCVSLLLNYVG